MFAEKETPVEFEAVKLGTLYEWSGERYQAVTSEEERFKKALDKALEQMREKGVEEKYINTIGRNTYIETLKENLLVIYARAAAKEFFNGKTREEIDALTILDSQWLNEAVEEASNWIIRSTVRAINDTRILAMILGALDSEDEA